MGQHRKRKNLHQYMLHQNIDIFLLQETHVTNTNQHQWTNEFGKKCVWSCGQSNAKGCGILVGRTIQINKEVRDEEGRYAMGGATNRG